jgi:hypothetical protein
MAPVSKIEDAAMTPRKLSAPAIIRATQRKDQVAFAANACFALLVAGLAALNVVVIESAATAGKMSPINVAAIATGEGRAAN